MAGGFLAGCATSQAAPVNATHPSGTASTTTVPPTTTTTVPPTTTTTAPPTTTTTTTAPVATATPAPHGPLTSPPLPRPGAGFNVGGITAVGDSVMIDYQIPLEADLPGVNVQATVGEQWETGATELATLQSEHSLGAIVIVGLSTNGPITSGQLDGLLEFLRGASRVVLVNIHVDRPWQDPNNALLATAPAAYPNVRVVDWNDLANAHPEWFGGDGTHLAINGTGAQALAALIAAQA